VCRSADMQAGQEDREADRHTHDRDTQSAS